MTNSSRTLCSFAAVLFAAWMLVSCDVDPFGMERKEIVPGYQLEYFPDGKCYYLNFIDRNPKLDALEAVILEIGWSDQLILTRVMKEYRGDKDGVYSIERATGKIYGPIPEAALTSDERYKQIKLQKPEVIFPRKH